MHNAECVREFEGKLRTIFLKEIIVILLYGFEFMFPGQYKSVYVLPEGFEGVVADGNTGGEI